MVGTLKGSQTRQRYPKHESKGKVKKQARFKIQESYDCDYEYDAGMWAMRIDELATRQDTKGNICGIDWEWLDTAVGDTIRDQVHTDEEEAGQTGTWNRDRVSAHKIKQEDMKHEGENKILNRQWNMTISCVSSSWFTPVSISFIPAIPNHRAADRYRSVCHLVLGRTEKKISLLMIRVWKMFYFEK